MNLIKEKSLLKEKSLYYINILHKKSSIFVIFV